MSLNAHFREISWNLQMISSIIIDQTLQVNDKKVFIENRGIWAAFWRPPSTRNMVLNAITFTWELLDELLVSYQNCALLTTLNISEQDKQIVFNIFLHLNEICNYEDPIKIGLNTLTTFKRYQTDYGFTVQVRSLILEFQKICNRAKSIIEKYSK